MRRTNNARICVIVAVCGLLMLAMAPQAWAFNQEVWTLYQERTVAKIDTVTNAITVYGTGIHDPARPSDPPGPGWTTIGISSLGELVLARRNQAGTVWLYRLPSQQIIVSGGIVTNVQTIGSTGLTGNVDGLAVGPDGNVYFTAYSVSGGPAVNGLYRYDVGLHMTEYVGTFTGNGGAGQANSFYTDFAFQPGTNGDLVGQGKVSATQWGLYRIPRNVVLNGTNQTFPYMPYSGTVLTAERLDGVAFDPTSSDLFLSGDARGVSRVDAQGANPVLLPGTNPDLGWDLANQVEGCSSTRTLRALCVPGAPGTYTLTFDITNNSSTTAFYWSVPDQGPYTVTPHTQAFNPPLAAGATQQVTITIHGATAGQQTCLRGVLSGATGEECCTFQVCTEIPECECVQVYRDFAPHCTGNLNGSFTYTFQLQNLQSTPIAHIFVQPPPGVTITPDYFVPSPPIPPNGGIDTLPRTVTITGATPGSRLCFDITTVDPEIEECCTHRVCIDVPNCRWRWWDQDHIVTDFAAGAGGADVSRTPEGVTTAGFRASAFADRFTIAEPSAIEEISIPAYVERSATQEPFDFLGIEIWNGPPDRPESERVYGDLATNVLRNSSPAGVYRVLHDEPLTTSTRPIWYARAPLQQAAVLQPGTYWLVWTLRSPLGTPMQLYGVTRETVVPGGALLRNSDGTWTRAIAGAKWPEGASLPFRLRESVLPEGEGIVLNTGYDPVLQNVLPFGSDDEQWQVVAPGSARPAKVVSNAPAAWGEPFPDSRWISATANGVSLPDVTTTTYERCFCLGDEGGAVTLDLKLRADNSASVLLNDQLLGGPGGAFSGSPLELRRVGTIGDGLFVPGRNCIRVEVQDQGLFTGFDLTGTVEAPEGCEP